VKVSKFTKWYFGKMVTKSIEMNCVRIHRCIMKDWVHNLLLMKM